MIIHGFLGQRELLTYDTFKSLVLKPQKKSIFKDAKRFESNQKLSDAVAKDKYGIGFTGFAYINNSKALSLESECNIRSIPNDFSVKTEEYPLARRLFLYTTNKSSQPTTKAIVKTALADDAQPIVEKIGFINQQVMISSGNQKDARFLAAFQTVDESQMSLLKKLAKQTDNARRVSVTFRFKSGSKTLDNKAQEDIGRLARFLKKTENKAKEIMLLGFSDSKGDFAKNRALSKKRAIVVQQKLKEEGVTASLVEGYGELAPVSCNTGRGLDKNRRVEVWIKK